MKTTAVARDPDGYRIELCNRSPKADFKEKFNFSQTTIRVKNPHNSLAFYRDLLGMTLLSKSNKGDFTVYFLAHLEPGVSGPVDPEVSSLEETRTFSMYRRTAMASQATALSSLRYPSH